MPILGGSPGECFKIYADHVGPLISRTLTDRYQAKIIGPTSRRMLNIQNWGAGHTIPLDSSTHGRIHFYLGQELEALRRDEGDYRLHPPTNGGAGITSMSAVSLATAARSTFKSGRGLLT